MSHAEAQDLVEALLAGEHRALARVITKIENRAPGHRELVSALHAHTGDATIVGITGSPGAGKSTLVDKLARVYRERDETVGVIAVDPSSPYSGGAVLGDRIRMASNVGDMDVFFRSMSTRGQLGGLSTATAEAVTALDAFGKDRIVVETVGAGQNEIDVVRTADTVVVLVQPGSGDDIQMLKAGILEIGDVFVVNKADMEGADRTVAELEEMIHMRASPSGDVDVGHHGEFDDPDARRRADGKVVDSGRLDGTRDAVEGGALDAADEADERTRDAPVDEWVPEIVETVATTGEGVDTLVAVLDDHQRYLVESGGLEQKARTRYADEIRRLVRTDLSALTEAEIDRRGGIEAVVAAVIERETDPYTVAAGVVDPIRECVEERREE